MEAQAIIASVIGTAVVLFVPGPGFSCLPPLEKSQSLLLKGVIVTRYRAAQ